MDVEEFEGLLQAAGRREAVPQAVLDRVVERTRPPVRRKRRSTVLAGGALAVGLLVAAAATSDRWMHEEPFQSLLDGEYRVRTPVTAHWAMADGERDVCRGFVVYQGLSASQSERAEAWMRTHAADWDGLGQRLVDAAGAQDGPYETAEAAVTAGLDPVLRQAARDALPEAVPQGSPSGTRVAGWGIHCERRR